ncbi:MAG: hypothetical protein U5S82_12440 [Gammaproteobacteria bacterium]|nr:hypothetical protein [Gammaproteobacteria bacterium]
MSDKTIDACARAVRRIAAYSMGLRLSETLAQEDDSYPWHSALAP